MSFEANIEICGIHFVVTSRHDLSAQNIPATYRPFYKKNVSDAEVFNITVSNKAGILPNTDTLKKIFDSELSWSMYKDEDQYYLSLDPSAIFKKISCHAQFDARMSTATLYNETADCGVNDSTGVLNPFCYPLDQILLMYILAGRQGALIHAAGMNVSGRGLIFPGKSGAGKSTLSRLFLGRDNIKLLSDDRMIIRKIDNRFLAFGTPWAGDAGIAENKSVFLDRLFFIHHANNNRLEEISPQKALERLMPVTSIPWYDREVMSDLLSFSEDLVMNIPSYDLYFRPDDAVVSFLENFIFQDRI